MTANTNTNTAIEVGLVPTSAEARVGVGQGMWALDSRGVLWEGTRTWEDRVAWGPGTAIKQTSYGTWLGDPAGPHTGLKPAGLAARAAYEAALVRAGASAPVAPRGAEGGTPMETTTAAQYRAVVQGLASRLALFVDGLDHEEGCVLATEIAGALDGDYCSTCASILILREAEDLLAKKEA